jgi:hypothetical protein
MAIVEVREKRRGRTTTQGADWKRTYTRIFQIKTTSDVGMKTVREGLGLDIGDTYVFGLETDAGAFVNSIEVSCDDDSSRSWTATVQYGPIDTTVKPLNPLDEKPRVAWGWAQFQEAVTKDRDDNPILNTAFDPFDPPLARDQSRPVLGLVRNEATFDQDLADSLRDTVNDDVWWGAAAGKVKIGNISAARQNNPDAGGWYWEVSYEFQFNRDGWAAKPLNAGFRQLNSTGDKQEKIYRDGSEISSPALLDVDGHAIDPGGTPLFLEFDIYPESDFSLLNFDAFYVELTT